MDLCRVAIDFDTEKIEMLDGRPSGSLQTYMRRHEVNFFTRNIDCCCRELQPLLILRRSRITSVVTPQRPQHPISKVSYISL